MSKASQKKKSAYSKGFTEGLKGLPPLTYNSVKKKARAPLYAYWMKGFRDGQKEYFNVSRDITVNEFKDM